MSQLGFSNQIVQTDPNPYPQTIHYTTHSMNGWMNDIMFVQYLNMLWFHIPYDENYTGDSIENRLYLVCDLLPTHHGPVVRGEAEILNIELIIIPPGCTDEYQPLDRRIFGSMNNKHERTSVNNTQE